MTYSFGNIVTYYSGKDQKRKQIYVLKQTGDKLYGIRWDKIGSNIDKMKLLYVKGKNDFAKSHLTSALNSTKEKLNLLSQGKMTPESFFSLYFRPFLYESTKNLFYVENINDMSDSVRIK